MERSRAKELAVDQVKDLDPRTLDAEHKRLGDELTREPPPQKCLDRIGDEAERARHALEATREHITGLKAEREETSWLARSERARLKDLADVQKDIEGRQRERWELADAEHRDAATQTDAWLERHGDDATRFIAIDHERGAR